MDEIVAVWESEGQFNTRKSSISNLQIIIIQSNQYSILNNLLFNIGQTAFTNIHRIQLSEIGYNQFIHSIQCIRSDIDFLQIDKSTEIQWNHWIAYFVSHSSRKCDIGGNGRNGIELWNGWNSGCMGEWRPVQYM